MRTLAKFLDDFDYFDFLRPFSLGKYALLLMVPLTWSCVVFRSHLDPLPLLANSLPLLLRRFLRPAKTITWTWNGSIWSSVWEFVRSFFRKESPCKTYDTPEQEDAYWRNAELGQKELSFSDARFGKGKSNGPWNSRGEKPIVYYVPRLLPEYREKRGKRDDQVEFNVPAKSVVRWHWLVFPGDPHPTFVQASRLVRYLSTRDLRQMYHISKFGRKLQMRSINRDAPCCPAKRTRGVRRIPSTGQVSNAMYKELWREWLQNKPSDPIICFEDED
ncbi:uncharacterized protein FOMMEDRAFT_157886 [Fomitiporia mediterranea MF3/22]|uniref:uncharacterized protein n=1 Tax=Fomitiporia mediterranea (strain MF3/22) TaxID=694068 RepID=UPI00044084B9|nr:uncharacterized protein FOMMEDRAFT_157886 [Fomitiporia mediterranea MF3/22]EJD00779.1 hypothetical protein FOMMEDRAFT_157886 [Fomitiporia mediterranea MF3/22]